MCITATAQECYPTDPVKKAKELFGPSLTLAPLALPRSIDPLFSSPLKLCPGSVLFSCKTFKKP